MSCLLVPCVCRNDSLDCVRSFSKLGAVQKEEHDEEGVSLLAVRLPRSELNRLVSREGVVPTEFIEQHTLQ